MTATDSRSSVLVGYAVDGTPILGEDRGLGYILDDKTGAYVAGTLPYLDAVVFVETFPTPEAARRAFCDKLILYFQEQLRDPMIRQPRIAMFEAALRHLKGRGWPTDERVRVALNARGWKIDNGTRKAQNY